jgi:hypothetical protein
VVEVMVKGRPSLSRLDDDQIPAKCHEAVEVASQVVDEAEVADPALVPCQTLASHTKRCKSPK